MLKKIFATALVACMLLATGCSYDWKDDYGVYLSDEYSKLPTDLSCKVVVVDAQYYSESEISLLHKSNTEVYSYLNIGSLEDFRDYYSTYSNLAIDSYENWDGEYWMYVGSTDWQSFIVDTLATELINKGVDGFFVDNADVYYQYQEDSIYNGVTAILEGLKATGKTVIINGGDVYVSKYLDENGSLDNICDGVNQETVFTSINWDDGTFSESSKSDREYYMDYLDSVREAGKKVYVIEYTNDEDLAKKIKKECKELGYILYISDSIELD